MKPQVRNPMNRRQLEERPPHHKIKSLTPKPAPAKFQSSDSDSNSESESEAEEEPQHVAKKRVASEVGGSAGKKSKFIRRVWSDKVNFDRVSVGVANVQEFVMEKGLGFLGDEKRAEMQAKWKSLQLDELKYFARTRELSVASPEMFSRRRELLARRQELLNEQTDLLIEALED